MGCPDCGSDEVWPWEPEYRDPGDETEFEMCQECGWVRIIPDAPDIEERESPPPPVRRGKRGPKPRAAADLRTVCVACRLTEAEAATLDQGRPDGMSRGEWLRTRALARRLPRPIPAVNREAWRVLAKVAGNLAVIAIAMRGGDYREIDEIRDVVADLRKALIGVQESSE